jgi:hypothetical protein
LKINQPCWLWVYLTLPRPPARWNAVGPHFNHSTCSSK